VCGSTISSARFGRYLGAGVAFEDRQDLLGHKSGRITTHYSQAEPSNLIAAADKVCESDSRKHMASTSNGRREQLLTAKKTR
jgi:hypothetical protein